MMKALSGPYVNLHFYADRRYKQGKFAFLSGFLTRLLPVVVLGW